MNRTQALWSLLAVFIVSPAAAASSCPKIDYVGFFSRDSAVGSRLFVELKVAGNVASPITYVGTKEKNRFFLSADREAALQYLEPGSRDWKSSVSSIISRLEPKDAVTVSSASSASVFVPWDIVYFVKSNRDTQFRYVLRDKAGSECPSRPFELQDGKAKFTYEYFK